MTRWMAAFLILAAVSAQGGDDHSSIAEEEIRCSYSWYQFIEEAVATGDGQGHGPDVGSAEWKSVIAFKLDIRDEPNLPDRDSEAWCRHIDPVVRQRYAD